VVDRTPRVSAGLHRQSGHGRLRVVTYNVHKCRGLDRRVRPERIAEVLRGLDADVIALQEVLSGNSENGTARHDQVGVIAGELGGYQSCFGENRRLADGSSYGNAVLSRFSILRWTHYDVSHRRKERRGCLRADLRLPGGAEGNRILHIFNVHLGTGFLERRHQGPKLLSERILRHAALSGPRIVLGDFNEWVRGLTTRLLSDALESADLEGFTRRRRTYPGVLPLMHLDHVYHDRSVHLENFTIHRSRTALVASDHLPLVADFVIE
jgi:endonuclease/exonuclease/phosphatase family metal-dependent hydrolase